jgi:tetratricopeptide (TPR) repeat protein
MRATLPMKSGPIAAIAVAVLLQGSALWGQDGLARTHPKYRTAARVLDDLTRAIGDGRTKPTLRVLPTHVRERMQVAWYVPHYNEITIEERIYDAFASIGTDSLEALAWLLGHELAHCYANHGWVTDYGNGVADLDVGRTLEDLHRQMGRIVEMETEADYYGGLFGHVAGYDALGAAPQALAAMYHEYGFDAKLAGYPQLEERQEIARRAHDGLRRLLPAFDAGNSLLLVREYGDAARCFDFVARTLPSREILNNAGVARALAAIALFDRGELRYAYPIEFDAVTRLRIGTKASEDQPFGDDGGRRELLTSAREAFEMARVRDPEYAPSLVNLACVADLLGEHEDAVYWAGKAIRLAHERGETVSLAHALIARGIARARAAPADTTAARQDFESAAAGAAGLAAANLQALAGTAVDAIRPVKTRAPAKVERIADLSDRDYGAIMEAPDEVMEVPTASPIGSEITVYTRRTAQWSGLVIDTGHSTVSVLSTPDDYARASGRGVRRGQPVARVREAYGVAAYTMGAHRGTYHVYEEPRIVFYENATGHVAGWRLFRIKP